MAAGGDARPRTPGRGAEALSLPMLVANKAGVVLFMNEAMRRLLGARPKRLDRIFVDPVLRSGEEVECHDARRPGARHSGRDRGRGRAARDLPAAGRRTAAERRCTADFEHLPVALMMLAAAGALLAANRAARELLGLPRRAGAAATTFSKGWGGPVSDWIADVLAERFPAGPRCCGCAQPRPKPSCRSPCGGSSNRAGPACWRCWTMRPRSRRWRRSSSQSQKMQAIGQLAGGIAHDFNNLLTAISGHCDLLLLRHGRDEPEYADLVQIHQNANRAASLVGQLLAFSRKQTLKPERIDLAGVLSDLTHLLNRLVGEQVSAAICATAPALGPIRADKRQLEQVLMNLVVNARDAMPEGGTIRIATEAVTLTRRAAPRPGRGAAGRLCGDPR